MMGTAWQVHSKRIGQFRKSSGEKYYYWEKNTVESLYWPIKKKKAQNGLISKCERKPVKQVSSISSKNRRKCRGISVCPWVVEKLLNKASYAQAAKKWIDELYNNKKWKTCVQWRASRTKLTVTSDWWHSRSICNA